MHVVVVVVPQTHENAQWVIASAHPFVQRKVPVRLTRKFLAWTLSAAQQSGLKHLC